MIWGTFWPWLESKTMRVCRQVAASPESYLTKPWNAHLRRIGGC
jgi:hypothetical protein